MTVPPIFATFKFYKGATFSTGPFGLKNPDGTAQDITDWTAVMKVWREGDDTDTATPLYTLTSVDGDITIDGVAGEFEAVIPFSDTNVAVDEDGEMWPCRIVLTNPTPNPDYVERTVQGYILASK